MFEYLINLFKLNTKEFEELSFANSYFSMPKDDFFNNHFLLASNNDFSSKNDSSQIEEKYGHIEIQEKKSIFSSIKNRIKKLFTKEPKTFLLGDGQELDLGGNVEQRPIYSFFTNFGSKLVEYTQNIRLKAHREKIKNNPLEYSTALATVEKAKTPESNGLINQNPQKLNAPPSIIPTPALEEAVSGPKSIVSTDTLTKISEKIFKPIKYTSHSKISIYENAGEINLNKRENSISSRIQKHHRRSLAAISSCRGFLSPTLEQTHTISKPNTQIDKFNNREDL